MQRLLIVAIIVVSCALGDFFTSAFAQLDIFGSFANNLTPEDIAMMKDTSAELYESDSVPLSTTKQWSNAESGNSGTVALIRRFEYKGMKCRTIRHTIWEKSRDHASALNFDRCKTPSGEWKLR